MAMLAPLLFAWVLFAPLTGLAFTIDESFLLCNPGPVACPGGPGAGQSIAVTPTLERAPRWSAAPTVAGGGAGLHDGIQVGIQDGFAEAITGEVGTLNTLLLDFVANAAFAAWESPVLQFDVVFDSPSVVEGIDSGHEIDVFAVPQTHPVFAGTDLRGFSFFGAVFSSDRLLTHGGTLAGWEITSGDLYFSIEGLQEIRTILQQFGSPPSFWFAYVQNLMMHEIGHAIGFDHPHEFPFANFDTDGNPTNAMAIDPNAPIADLMVSTHIDPDAIMVTGAFGNSVLITSLRNDEIGGRSVLYPIPEPAALALALAGLAALALGHRIGSQ